MTKSIVLAGGCFWAVEHLYRSLPGVVSAHSGYANGRRAEWADYEKVCTGLTGFREAVQVTYDPEVMTLSPELNTPEMICPATGKFGSVEYGDDMLKFTASSTALFDFSAKTTPFVKLVFDVNELDPEMPEITKVDLTVDMLIAARRDSKSGLADPESEVIIVANSGLSQRGIDSVSLSRKTTLTPDTFVQATHDEPSEPTTSVVTTAATEGTTVPPTPPRPTEPPKKEDEPPLSTGSLLSVCLILGIELVATGALFVMRKKEILY